MRKKQLILSSLVFALAVCMVAFVASAKGDTEQEQNQNQQQNVGSSTQQVQGQNQEQEQGQNENINQTSTEDVQGTTSESENAGSDHESATGSEMENENHATTTGELSSEEHRSVVASFVQGLLGVANNEQGGIGQQVRQIAQEQNDSASTTAQAIDKVQKRNKIQTFLFGSDYKNLGVLRSEMVTTQNQIDQLNNLLPSIQNASDSAVVQNQIQSLQQQETQINNFIQQQEGQFSLFGWLVKLFNH